MQPFGLCTHWAFICIVWIWRQMDPWIHDFVVRLRNMFVFPGSAWGVNDRTTWIPVELTHISEMPPHSDSITPKVTLRKASMCAEVSFHSWANKYRFEDKVSWEIESYCNFFSLSVQLKQALAPSIWIHFIVHVILPLSGGLSAQESLHLRVSALHFRKFSFQVKIEKCFCPSKSLLSNCFNCY